jgi:hypothetical protein
MEVVMKKVVFGLASSEAQAQRIVSQLLSAGFHNEDISILSPDQNQPKVTSNRYGEAVEGDFARTADKDLSSSSTGSKASEMGAVGAAAGGVLGGSLGLLAGIGSLAIPGLGALIAAGPIMAALSGSAVGGGLGLLVGAIVGAGIPENEAKRYEAGLKAGNILISAHADTREEVTRAYEIMKNEGAKDISSTNETSESKL